MRMTTACMMLMTLSLIIILNTVVDVADVDLDYYALNVIAVVDDHDHVYNFHYADAVIDYGFVEAEVEVA
jgi:hypothetical protein